MPIRCYNARLLPLCTLSLKNCSFAILDRQPLITKKAVYSNYYAMHYVAAAVRDGIVYICVLWRCSLKFDSAFYLFKNLFMRTIVRISLLAYVFLCACLTVLMGLVA